MFVCAYVQAVPLICYNLRLRHSDDMYIGRPDNLWDLLCIQACKDNAKCKEFASEDM